ncbi:MAG: RidA family protein [Saprospiraceae bacterium]|nr:RidA family protein [Saprospiraceae bacterium]MBP9746776.1 RidA family protein [Saprospiraceae bacterium]
MKFCLLLFIFGSFISSTFGQLSTDIPKEKYHWGIITQDTVYGYAGVVRQGNTLYFSGVTASGDFPTQVNKVYITHENNLKRFGATFQNVVKETVFTTSIDSIKKYTYIRKSFYHQDYPAATWIGINELFLPDRNIEVELIAQLPSVDPKASMKEVTWPAEWLQGQWLMNTPRGQIMESWSVLSSNNILGHTYSISNGDTSLIESINLLKESDGIYYVPIVKDQNQGKATRFKMTSAQKNTFVFENHTHDFPKRIVYDFKSPDILHAWVDGGVDMLSKRSDFFYHRIR